MCCMSGFIDVDLQVLGSVIHLYIPSQNTKLKILFWLSALLVFILPSPFLVHWPQSIRICQLFKNEASLCPCPEKSASNKGKALFQLNETSVSFLWEMLSFLMGFCLSKCYNLPVGSERLSINLKYKVMFIIHVIWHPRSSGRECSHPLIAGAKTGEE